MVGDVRLFMASPRSKKNAIARKIVTYVLNSHLDVEAVNRGDNLRKGKDTTTSGGPIGGCGPEISKIPPGRAVGDV